MDKKPDIFIFDISKRHGIEEDTVAYMLTAWIFALSNFETWLDRDCVEQLQSDFNLDGETIEYVSNVILDALECTHILDRVRSRVSMVEEINTYIDQGRAEVRVVWG